MQNTFDHLNIQQYNVLFPHSTQFTSVRYRAFRCYSVSLKVGSLSAVQSICAKPQCEVCKFINLSIHSSLCVYARRAIQMFKELH